MEPQQWWACQGLQAAHCVAVHSRPSRIGEEDLGDDRKYKRCHFNEQFSGSLPSPTPCRWQFFHTNTFAQLNKNSLEFKIM